MIVHLHRKKGEAIPLRGLEGVPGLPGAPQGEAGLTANLRMRPVS